jgi:hypothetical protein
VALGRASWSLTCEYGGSSVGAHVRSRSVTSVTVVGVRGHLVAVEADVGRGLPFLTLLGLPRGGDQDAPTGFRRRPSAYAIARTRTEIPPFPRELAVRIHLQDRSRRARGSS